MYVFPMWKQIIIKTCYISSIMGIRKVSNSKSDHHAHPRSFLFIPFDSHMWFPISFPL